MIKRVKNLWYNFKYLKRNRLEEKEVEIQENIIDFLKYEFDEDDKPQMLNILEYSDTVSLLLKEPKSFVRLGDGEIELIKGNAIPFQEYDQKLAQILLSTLNTYNKNCYVGINYNYFHSTRRMNQTNRRFYLRHAKQYRDFLLENCIAERIYIAAGFNQIYASHDTYDFRDYYDNIKNLFGGEVVIFCGENILQHLQYDVFEKAKTKEFVFGPRINAFRKFDELLELARSLPKDKILCFILGPTSKALVWKLSQEGYLAYDVGHLAKDYDTYMRGIKMDERTVVEFYKPD